MIRELALVALGALAGCGPSKPPSPPPPPPVPLHLSPACDLAPAAGISWLVEASPRAIAQAPDLIPAIALLLPEDRLRGFAAAHGGVDLRQIEELCIARYREATLVVARTPFDPSRVIKAFDDRSTKAVSRTKLAPNPVVVRATGQLDAEPQRLVLFGREALVLEEGTPGPGRAAEAFAFGRLKRAAPALRGSALARAAQVLGDAPLRAFAPGPFEGEAAQGFGGLLRASTAIGLAATPVEGTPRVAVKLVVTGAWGDDAPAAAERLAASVHVLSESPVGRLFGLDHPLEGPRVRAAPEALVLEATFDANTLARGVHDAVDAEVSEILRR